MTIDNERLAKFEGKCWHEPHEIYLTNNHMVATTPVQECALCGCRYPEYPSYSTSPDDREHLWLYLVGKEEMWDEFFLYELSYGEYRKPIPWTQFIVWLFSPLDGVPRWVSLLSDWLGLEETREKFGWIDCPKDEPIEIDDGDCKYMACKNATEYCTCDGSGKVRAEWAKEG